MATTLSKVVSNANRGIGTISPTTGQRHAGIDPLKQGYDSPKSYEPIAVDVSAEAIRALIQLDEEHGRKLAKFEAGFRRKAENAEKRFKPRTADETDPAKVEERRARFDKQVAKAYADFEQKIAAVNKRFDKRRDKLLSKAGAG